MSTKLRLRFDGLPTFESTPMFFSLDSAIDASLRAFPRTYARCNAALRFMSTIGADAHHMRVSEGELDHMRVAYLRASLMEFAGMEEALRSDLSREKTPLRISDTQNAMLVVLRELRNVQVHLVKNELLASTRRAVLRYREEEHQSELVALTVPRADLNLLKDPRTAPYCHRGDFESAVDWLAAAQEHWGIADVVMRGIWSFAEAIVAAHVTVSEVSCDASLELA